MKAKGVNQKQETSEYCSRIRDAARTGKKTIISGVEPPAHRDSEHFISSIQTVTFART
jgi:hypothetical protein